MPLGMPKPMHEGPITVVIADDHRSFGEALEVALDKELDLRVIEVVTDGESAVESASRAQPDVVLMDLQMPGVDGIEATRRIHDEATGTAVIILSGQNDDISLARAIQAGARGYLRKTEAVVGLAEAIRRAHRGEPCTPAPRWRSRCGSSGGAARWTATSRSGSNDSRPVRPRSCSGWPTGIRPRRSLAISG